MPVRKMSFNGIDFSTPQYPEIEKEDGDYQILTGAELMRTAIDDWQNFADNDETLIQWYPKLDVVLPNKKYKAWPELQFEEAEDGTGNL